MAKNIKGITIEIAGNTQPLNKSLEGVNKKSRDLQSELRQVDRLLKLDPKNTELVAQKQQLLGEAVSTTRDKLTTLKEAQKQVEEQFRRGEIGEEQYRAIQREVISTEQNLKSLERQLKDVNNKWKDAGKAVGDFGKKTTDIGKKMLPATAAITGLAAGATYAAMELEATEAKYSTVFGEFSDQADQFIKDFKKLTPATTAEARNMASGIQDLLIPMGFMRDEATKMTGDTMHLVGALANFNSGTHTAQDVASAFSSALTGSTEPLKRLGIQVNQASIEAYALANGFVEANVDSVKLKKALVDIEVQQKKYNDAVKKYGEDSLEARKALAELEVKEQSRDKLMEGQKVALDNQTKAQVILAMAYEQSGDALAAYTEENLDAKTQMSLFTKDVQDLAAEFGKVLLPVLKDLLGFARDLIERFSGMDDSTKKVIVVIAGLVAAIGPLLIIIGSIASGIGALMPVLGVVAGAIGAISAPVLLVVAGIAALIAIIILVIKYWDEIVAALKAGWQWLSNVFQKWWEDFSGFWAGLWDGIKSTLTESWDTMKKLFILAVGTIVKFATDRFNAVTDFFTGVKDKIVNVFTTIKDKILGIWQGIVDGIKGFINKIIGAINGMIGGMNKLKFDVPDWVPVIGGKTWGMNIPKIPTLHTGTDYFTPPNGMREGLALLERGEKVIPKGQATSSEVKHSGTIRVEGVNDKGQLAAVVDIVLEQLMQEVRT